MGWLRSDRLQAVTVGRPLPIFHDMSIKRAAIIEISIIECVKDL
jgi:hypothetical protein